MPFKNGEYIHFDREEFERPHEMGSIEGAALEEYNNPNDWHAKEFGFPLPREFDVIERDGMYYVAISNRSGCVWNTLGKAHAEKLMNNLAKALA